MAELVVKLGIKREPGYLYFVGNGKLYRTKMVPARDRRGEPDPGPGPEDVVAELGITQDPDYDYFIDMHGDIRRTRRQEPLLVHPPGAFDNEPIDEAKRQAKIEELKKLAAEMIAPCSVCGKPVVGRNPPRDEDGRRRHPGCSAR